mgnify:CR=1 FL=1
MVAVFVVTFFACNFYIPNSWHKGEGDKVIYISQSSNLQLSNFLLAFCIAKISATVIIVSK